MKKLFGESPCLENERILLRRLVNDDILYLKDMTSDEKVYKYLPTFLFEQQYDDLEKMITDLYGECFAAKESLILAIEEKQTGQFCGLEEFYGFKDRQMAEQYKGMYGKRR